VSRDTSSTRADLANALALPSQNPDFHCFLRHQHEALRYYGVPHAGVGQFSIGDPGRLCTGGYKDAANIDRIKDVMVEKAGQGDAASASAYASLLNAETARNQQAA